jgi:hypothetical protein
MKWHPRIPSDELPEFLHDYWVVHGDMKTQSMGHAVHSLYHRMFNNWTDRKEIMPALRMGETIAVMREDRSTVVSALTFLARENSVVILFLSTLDNYWMTGMATFLFSLIYQVVRCRERKPKVRVYLKANKTAAAWTYYTKRGFEEMKIPTFPLPLQECFEGELPDSPMNGYSGMSGDLSWLYKQYTVSNFVNKKGNNQTCHRFFRNPSCDRCPSVYAQLPGNLTFEQIQHCAPDFSGEAQRSCLTNLVFSAGIRKCHIVR